MPEDFFETEHVIREIFRNHYTPACSEHYLMHIMRECQVFVPELDLVAVDRNRMVGNCMCLKAYIMGDDGNRYEVLSLGSWEFFSAETRIIMGIRDLLQQKNMVSVIRKMEG